MIYDSILVGQGIAGSCLAWQLLRRGKRILVFDQPQLNRSTAVAAGLFNPVAGQWMLKTWMADTLFPYLHTFYKEVETETKSKMLHSMPVYRPFVSYEEQNEWMAKSTERGLNSYIQKVFVSSQFGDTVRDEFGGVLISQSGYVDTPSFCNGVKEKLKLQESYCEDYFDADNIRISGENINYNALRAKTVVFCDGIQGANGYFNWLPFRPLKGETMEIKLSQKLNQIYNRGVYIVPAGTEGIYKVGATYDREANPGISISGQEELERKLNDLLVFPFEVKNREWGIRPAIEDRRPVLGAHPEFNKILIFNGLGTKGVSLAPYFSSVMADWMDERMDLPKEINIGRYKSLYSKSLA